MMSGDCRGAGIACPIADGPALTEQLKTGRKLAIEIVTRDGRLDQDVMMRGFSEALAAASRER